MITPSCIPTDLMVVSDAMSDERFRDSPLVLGEPGIRFYAGAPVLSIGGLALGTLGVMDPQPRRLVSVSLGSRAPSGLDVVWAGEWNPSRLAKVPASETHLAATAVA